MSDIHSYSSFIHSQSHMIKTIILGALKDDIIKYYNDHDRLINIQTIVISIRQYIDTNYYSDINNILYSKDCENMIHCIQKLLI